VRLLDCVTTPYVLYDEVIHVNPPNRSLKTVSGDALPQPLHGSLGRNQPAEPLSVGDQGGGDTLPHTELRRSSAMRKSYSRQRKNSACFAFVSHQRPAPWWPQPKNNREDERRRFRETNTNPLFP
jgi:hypothetical protein